MSAMNDDTRPAGAKPAGVQDRSCRWWLSTDDGAIEAECCHDADHDGDHHVLFGYVPGSVSLGTDGDDGVLALADADWQDRTTNPWSSYYVERTQRRATRAQEHER